MVFKLFRLIVLYSVLFFACEKKYDIEIDGGESVKEVVFGCGKITITTYCVSRSHFFVDLDFDLQKPTFFFKDSLSVEFKGEAISFELTDGEFIVEDTRVELNNGKDYKIEFTINSPLVNKGDVIIIKDLGYLHCDNQRIKVGNIELNIK